MLCVANYQKRAQWVDRPQLRSLKEEMSVLFPVLAHGALKKNSRENSSSSTVVSALTLEQVPGLKVL